MSLKCPVVDVKFHYMSKCGGYIISPLNINPTKWSNKGSNTPRQFVGRS